MRSEIRLSRSDIGLREYLSVLACLKEGMLGMGKYVGIFEDLLSSFFDAESVCVSSGTSALHLALESLNLEKGSEVLVPSLTYVATFQAIKAAGLTPRPVDVDPLSGNINIEKLIEAYTSSCKVVVPVLYAGNTSNYRTVLNWAKENSLRVVCDAAHAFGSKDKGQLVGNFGDVTCFSFDGIKNITSGEGGCIVSNDLKLINLVKDKRLLSVNKDSEMRYKNKRSWDFEVFNQGWRYHMSNIHASIGISQFKKREKFFKKRQKLALFYDKLLADSEIVEFFNRDYHQIVPHIYPVKLNPKINKIKFINYLKDNKIQIGIHYKPNHKLSFFKSKYSLPNTEDLYARLLSLPLHTLLSLGDLRYIISTITKYKN